MTQLAPPSSSPGLLGRLFPAQAAVQDAAQAFVANRKQPDQQRIYEDFRRYAQLHPKLPVDQALEKFMVRVREQLKKEEVVVDPLVMYALHCDIGNTIKNSR